MSGSVHLWGFFATDGNPGVPDGAAPSDLSPFDHHERIARHVAHFGGTIEALRVTRTLDGWLVATEFETAPRAGCRRMWHRVIQPHDEWPDFPVERKP